MSEISRNWDQATPRGSGQFIAKRWIALLGVPALAAFCYLCLVLWFVVHQRDFQYTPGGTSGSPEAVGLEGFAEVYIATEDGERIVGWWAPPPPGRGVVLFLHGTPSTLPDTVWRLPELQKNGSRGDGDRLPRLRQLHGPSNRTRDSGRCPCCI